MKILALDLSTKTGYAVLNGEMGSLPTIETTGLITIDKPVVDFGVYPLSHVRGITALVVQIMAIVDKHKPDKIVIEEVNLGRSRYVQKVLDGIHYHLCFLLEKQGITPIYINTGDWRRKLSITLTAADKKQNVTVRKLKKAGNKEALKALGVRGKLNKKHMAIRYVNNIFGLDFKMKDNDRADSICQGVAYFLGVAHCDGR